MPEPPKAHRRLVPRKPRPSDSPDTAPVEKSPLPEPDDSMEMTEVRPAFRDRDRPGLDVDDLEITARRTPVPPAPDDVSFDDLAEEPPRRGFDDDDDEEDATASDADVDAADTLALPIQNQAQGSFVLRSPDLDDAPAPEQFSNSSQRALHLQKQKGLPLGLDAASAKFRPAATVHDDQLPPVAQVHEHIDPNAFSDLEPTALKAPSVSPDAEDRPTTHISPAERGLLAAMSEGHEASRLVYMQWLEKRGEKQRAEFLKVEHSLATMNPLDIRFQETQDRLRDLAQKISIDWRSRVARSLIESCMQSNCPRYWRALPATADDGRDCGTCGSQVYYCASIDLARRYAMAGSPVAVDVTVERHADDLAPHCSSCGNVVPGGTRFCPHCGRSMY